jgi:aminoglycoside phosphotransferase (APT) family kinase protein
MVQLHRLDPAPVYERLGAAAPTLPRVLDGLEESALVCGRSDLAAAARWLRAHQPPAGPIVICHGDLHPFNLLVDDSGAVTVLDWSAARLAPAALDVAFTNLLLSEPPVAAPTLFGPVLGTAGRLLARRFRRAYAERSGTIIDGPTLRWHEAATCLRALVEVARWAGDTDRRAGHPWLVCGEAFACRLSHLTGVPVTPR